MISCESHAPKMLQHLYGEVRVSGVTDAECPACRTERQKAEQPALVRAALLSPKLSHTRARNWCGVTVVYVYHFDKSSPSGVVLAAGCDEPMYNDIARELRGHVHSGALAPLSPTEAR